MKRTLLATAIGLTFIGVTAQTSFAQSYSVRGDDSAQYAQPPEQGSPPGDHGWSDRRWRHEQRGRDSQAEPNENDYGPPGRASGGPPPPPHRPPPPPPANAARFIFQRGPARIDITCPQVFALQDCIEAATSLLDKIHDLRTGAQHPGASQTPGGGTNPPAGSSGGSHQQVTPGAATTPQLAPPNPGGDNRM